MRRFLPLALLLFAGCSSTQTGTPSFTPIPGLSARDESSITQSRLKVLGLGVMVVTQDNKDVFPDMSTSEAMRTAVLPEVSKQMGEAAFVHPTTGHLFVPNPNLSNKPLSSFPDLALTPAVWEADATASQTRNVLFADGHVKQLSEANWQAIKSANKIP